MGDAARLETVGRSKEDAALPLKSPVSGTRSSPQLDFLCSYLCLSTKAGVMGRERRWAKPQGRPEELGGAGFQALCSLGLHNP